MLLEVKNLSCGYGKTPLDNPVVKNISFTLDEGKSLAILGANGSGKTTLLRAIGGVIEYDGSISMLGREIGNLKRKEIAAMQATFSQLSTLYFSYTIEETVMLGRYLYSTRFMGILSEKDKEIVDKCLKQNGLYQIKDKQIGELSGGQLQRVFLARTLAQETPVLMLDEPTNHLDLKYQDELMSFLNEWKTQSTTLSDGTVVKNMLIGVFHDINLALGIADEVLFVREGEILAKGSVEEVLTDENLKLAYDMDVSSYMKKQLNYWK